MHNTSFMSRGKPQQERGMRESSMSSNMPMKARSCPFTAAGVKEIDYKDVETLKQFTTERGKVLPRRITGVAAHYQRKLTASIKRARYMALMPFVSKD